MYNTNSTVIHWSGEGNLHSSIGERAETSIPEYASGPGSFFFWQRGGISRNPDVAEHTDTTCRGPVRGNCRGAIEKGGERYCSIGYEFKCMPTNPKKETLKVIFIIIMC